MIESLVSFSGRSDDDVIRADDVIGLYPYVVMVTRPTDGEYDAVVHPEHLLVTLTIHTFIITSSLM